MKAKVNTMSLIETGRRQFTPPQRQLFFELIGQPEDTSIPVKASTSKPPIPKKAARPAKSTPKIATKSVKPAKQASLVDSPQTSEAPKESKTSTEASPKLTNRAVATKPDETPVKAATPKPVRKPRTPKLIVSVPPPPAPALPAPTKPLERVHIPTMSPVKDAVLRDVTRILNNPGLSETHVRRLHGLFLSLAVSALKGE